MEANTYDVINDIEERHWWHAVRRDILSKISNKYINLQGGGILDIGCGCGGNHCFLSKFGQVTGMEYDEHAVQYYCNKNPEACVYKGFLPDGIPGEISQKQYDFITMLDVLEHIEEEKEALKKVHLLLKRGGKLLVTVPAYNWMWSKNDDEAWHKRRYTKKRLKDLFQQEEWNIVYMTYFNTLLFPLAVFERKVLTHIYSAKKQTKAIDRELNVGILNKPFKFIFGLETLFIPKLSFPYGLSVCMVVEKNE